LEFVAAFGKKRKEQSRYETFLDDAYPYAWAKNVDLIPTESGTVQKRQQAPLKQRQNQID
jgi:hypothetical protein